MRTTPGFLSAAALTLLVFAPATAGADTITITGGFLDWPGSGAASLVLNGSGAFTFSSHASPSAGVFTPVDTCNFSLDCTAGAPVSLNAHWVGNDLTGTATYLGTTYPDVGGLSSLSSMSVTFSGTFTVPSGTGTVMTTAPFLFSGLFTYPQGSMLASANLTGAGTASITLAPNAGNAASFRITHLRYQFGSSSGRPTPEPASMLLLGAGLAGAAIARRRRPN